MQTLNTLSPLSLSSAPALGAVYPSRQARRAQLALGTAIIAMLAAAAPANARAVGMEEAGFGGAKIGALEAFNQPRTAEPTSAEEERQAEEKKEKRKKTAKRVVKAAEIIVTGLGLIKPPAAPAYSTVDIKRDRVTSTPSGRLEDALGAVAGFQQFRRSDSRSSNPSGQGASLRAIGGNASSRALVLLDGVPMSDPFFGFVPYSALATNRIGSVEVIRGGGSGPFGAGALTGTIAIESADRRQIGEFSGEALVNGRGGTEASLSFAPKLGDGYAVVSGRWDRGPGFYMAPEDQRVPASVRSKYDNWSFSTRVVAPLSDDVELQGHLLTYDDNRVLRFAGGDTGSEGTDASIRVVGRGDWQFDALAYVQTRDFNQTVISSTRYVPVLVQPKTPADGIGGKLELRPPVGRDHVLRIGADYRRNTGTLNEEAYSAFSGQLTQLRRGTGSTSDFGLYIEDDWKLGKVILTGGLRADFTHIGESTYTRTAPGGALVSTATAPSRNEQNLSWRTGALWNLGWGLKARAAAYQGLRVPTINELIRPFVVFPVVTEANPNLENEKLTGFEIGADWQVFKALKFSATLFDTKLKNAIANVTLGPNLRQRQNLPAIDSTGLELDSQVDIGPIRWQSSLLWVNSKVDGNGASAPLDGLRPAQTPKFMFDTTMGWKPRRGWRFALNLRHVGAQYEDDRESNKLPAFTTLNAFAEAKMKGGWSFVLRGENLLNEDIVTRNNRGVLDLGVPRTLWAGVRYKMR